MAILVRWRKENPMRRDQETSPLPPESDADETSPLPPGSADRETSPLPPESDGREDVMPAEDDTTAPGPDGSPLPPDPPSREDIIRQGPERRMP
jgi:hypothetical protein